MSPSPISVSPPIPPKRPPARSVLAGLGLLLVMAPAWTRPNHGPGPLLDLYDFSGDAGIQIKLPRVLEEISGLATTSDGRLFAHDDERALIHEIDPETWGISKSFSVGALAVRGDFEGIAVAGERFFLMTSSGQLVEFREGEAGSSVGYRVHSLGLGDRCEMEGLAFDPFEATLLMPCKTPRAGELRDHLVVLSVPLSSMRPDPIPRVFLPLAELDNRGLGDEFHPSAIEFHPASRSIVLVAAREEALVEVGPGGEILDTEELKRKAHPQPEGIAFLPDGSLVLADEGQGKRGTLTRYTRLDPEGGDDR